MTKIRPAERYDERRRACRHAPIQRQVWLGWLEGSMFRVTPARLMDISMKGARLLADKSPAVGQRIWFCPPGEPPPERVEAALVRVRKQLFRPREVRIIFLAPLPYETFKDIVFGPGALGDGKPDYWTE